MVPWRLLTLTVSVLSAMRSSNGWSIGAGALIGMRLWWLRPMTVHSTTSTGSTSRRPTFVAHLLQRQEGASPREPWVVARGWYVMASRAVLVPLLAFSMWQDSRSLLGP